MNFINTTITREANKFLFGLFFVSLVLAYVKCDTAKDKEECTQQLVGLATCLPYVGGNAKSPTPDCCNGLKQVLKTNKKCLCVIVEDRNDPDLGLDINVTLALGLPSVCNAPANITKCPGKYLKYKTSRKFISFNMYDYKV
ncbi:hypothetical protein LIER_42783 [Lithospermum erythrorhizon]|uniref:Bifunctional inhibitor/plant lipid transfer protein/seed storage helical domain-containing protein n=1 Tax=Lithospermum erythrorhizon TaxID=34254 RepID=A0AAV3NYK3_LITER